MRTSSETSDPHPRSFHGPASDPANDDQQNQRRRISALCFLETFTLNLPSSRLRRKLLMPLAFAPTWPSRRTTPRLPKFSPVLDAGPRRHSAYLQSTGQFVPLGERAAAQSLGKKSEGVRFTIVRFSKADSNSIAGPRNVPDPIAEWARNSPIQAPNALVPRPRSESLPGRGGLER
jgi:hypothetical protein